MAPVCPGFAIKLNFRYDSLNMRKNDFSFIIIFVLELLVVVLVWKFLISLSPITRIAEIESLKYELFRDLLMALVALLAIGIPVTYLLLKRTVEEKVNVYTERMKMELYCQLTLLSCVESTRERGDEIEKKLQKPGKEPVPELPTWLEKVIDRTRAALVRTEALDQKADEQLICQVKNNLAYYLTIARTDEEEARRLARETYEKAKKYNGWYHWIDTYVWVLWCFAKSEEEKKKALRIFYELYFQKEKIPNKEFKVKLGKRKVFFDQFKKF